MRELIYDARVVLDTYNNMSELVEEERLERLSKAKTEEEKAKVEQQYQQAKETLKKQYTNSKNYILEKLNKLKEEWDSVEEVYFQPNNSKIENKEIFNFDGTRVEDITNPLDYVYIHTQFKGVPKEQQEKIKLEINPDLNGRENEIVEPVEIKNYKVKTQSDGKNSVAKEIKEELFNATGRGIKPITVTNKKTNQTVVINASTIDESVKELLKGADKNLVATVLLNAGNIFKNSELIFINDEAKKENLKNQQKVYRYATQIEYDNENYIVVSTIFDNKKQQHVKIYHTAGYKNKDASTGQQKMPRTSTNISITDLVNFVKSRVVERYNNDYNSTINNVPQNNKNVTPNQANVTKHEDKNINYQSMTQEQLLNVYMNQEFGMSADDITDMVREDIERIVEEYDIPEDEFSFEDIRIYGSYSKGKNKVGSDLDIVVQYSGSLKEDSAFNIFHDEELSIYDKKGNKVKIDINPINTADHGTIDDYSKILFQSAYHGSPHRFDNFSTDNIGTGEGAQVHGWGLYFAGDKNISDGYRERLSDTYGIGTEIKIDNKTYKKVATNTYRNKDDLYESVDDYLNDAINFIETKGTKNEALKYIQKQIDIYKDEGDFNKAVYYVRIKDALNEIEQAKITKYADDYGQLYEVDIPDSDVLLDEDKTFSEQNENIKEILKQVLLDEKFSEWLEEEQTPEEFAEQEITDWELGFTGGNIYDRISMLLGSDKKASELLNKYGIKGITYDGRQDGRCYVIFDDKAVNVLKTYYQEGEQGNSTEENIKGSRGFTYQKETGQNVIENIIVLLNNKADKSTLLHEFGHVYLNVMHDLARTNNKARERLLTIDKWLRHEQGSEYTTAQHEKFARGFVAYIKQGKAPTYNLKKAFEHFKKWLGDIRDILEANNELDIDPEGMTVFDEILGGNLHEDVIVTIC